MSEALIAGIRELERASLEKLEQQSVVTHHLIHAGMYVRTIMIPAGVLLTGALIKRPTVLTLNGDVTIAGGARFTGYHVIPAEAHRKQAFLAHADTYITMSFPTSAKTVEEAEQEFTDEADRLLSRRGENHVVITQEHDS